MFRTMWNSEIASMLNAGAALPRPRKPQPNVLL